MGPEEHQGISSTPNFAQPPWARLMPFTPSCRSTNVATNTCCSALEQVQQGHQHPQMHEVLILTSLLAGEGQGGQCCRGTGKEAAQLERCLQLSCPTSLCSHHNTHTPFFPEEISQPATPLPHFQTVHHPGAQQPVPRPQAQSSPSSPFLETQLGIPSSPTPPQLPLLSGTTGREGLFCQLNCFQHISFSSQLSV